MKLFECQNCGAALHFENTRCESCGRSLGYLPARETITALTPDNGNWRAMADPKPPYRYCANAEHDVCNWLVRADQPDLFCAACRHNRTIPDLSIPENLTHWRKIEVAKHRLFYTLLKLRLPLATRVEDPNSLTFDFKAEVSGPTGHIPVMTGHESGLITINLAEADDVERERQRSLNGEPYRTLLGHFRHEIAHYFWDKLIAAAGRFDDFRAVFGDERQDYAAALQQHYANGPAPDWPARFVSAYASSHPWEDFAETWAHYFHMVDTLETGAAFGLRVRPRLSKDQATLSADLDFDPHTASMERLIDAWLPLTFTMNSINRSMGLSDLYPFVLTPAVIVKINFIHELIHSSQAERNARRRNSGLRALVAGLRRGLAQPT